MKKINFVNAQQMVIEHPDTFYAPTPEQLVDLTVGASVKVCVDNRERFWVTVTAIDGQDVTGTVDNNLIDVDLAYGEEIKFKKENIYNIWEM